MENIKNLEKLSLNIPKNLEKVENVILENEYIDNKNKNDEEKERLNKEHILKYKKLNEEARNNAKWTELDSMVIENLVNQFVTYSDENNIEWNRFDYSGDYDYDYYKKRFPLFDDDVINILVKCSKIKVEDKRLKPLEKKEGNFVVDFE